MIAHQFDGVKYTVIFHDSGKMEALRYGEDWRDLTGDGMVLAMLQDYHFLREQSDLADQQIECLMNEVEYLRDKLEQICKLSNLSELEKINC